jgi:hypothetical protein
MEEKRKIPAQDYSSGITAPQAGFYKQAVADSVGSGSRGHCNVA